MQFSRGTAGWLVGLGALALPGIGPVVAAGPIAAVLGVADTTVAVALGQGQLQAAWWAVRVLCKNPSHGMFKYGD